MKDIIRIAKIKILKLILPIFVPFIKIVSYGNISISIFINVIEDYLRANSYESYPVKVVLEDFNKNKEKIIYYEIGACTGISALLISKIVKENGSIVAFEADPTNYKSLVENVRLNNFSNILVMPVAISDKIKLSKFYFNTLYQRKYRSSSGVGLHSLHKDEILHNDQDSISVPAMSLDNVISDFNLEKPTHLFLDAYGSEEDIVNGIKNTVNSGVLKKIMIQIEKRSTKNNPFTRDFVFNLEDTNIYSILLSYGYALVEKEKMKFHKDILGYNCVFSKNK